MLLGTTSPDLLDQLVETVYVGGLLEESSSPAWWEQHLENFPLPLSFHPLNGTRYQLMEFNT